MGSDIRPYLASDGVPMCDDSCPSYDGKRCRVLGIRPGNICEPAVSEMVAEIVRLRESLALVERERDEARRQRDQALLDLGHEQDERDRELQSSADALMTAHADQLRAEGERDAARAEAAGARARIQEQLDYSIALQRMIEHLACGDSPPPSSLAPHLSTKALHAWELLTEARAEAASMEGRVQPLIDAVMKWRGTFTDEQMARPWFFAIPDAELLKAIEDYRAGTKERADG